MTGGRRILPGGKNPVVPLSFFFCNSTPAAQQQKGWWPLFALGRIFGVHDVTPKKTKNTVDVFRSYWVPCE